jgi:hypothetical protein
MPHIPSQGEADWRLLYLVNSDFHRGAVSPPPIAQVSLRPAHR